MKKFLHILKPELYQELVVKDPSLTTGSNKKVLWQCPKDPSHTYDAMINTRVSKNTGCPYCSGRFPVRGVNDIATTHPKTARLLKDQTLATQLSGKSNRYVDWVCGLGHVYSNSVCNMTSSIKESPCPYCSNKKTLKGFNDLETTHPALAKELVGDPTKVRAGSSDKVAWVCGSGHNYLATLVNRSSRGSGCPYCANKKVLQGFNDLATTHPELCQELVVTELKNTISGGHSKKIEWVCGKGHTWASSPRNRVQGKGCPYCSGRVPVLGVNNLEHLRPDLHQSLVEPEVLSVSSNKRVSWRCSKNPSHIWDAYVYSRTGSRTTGCPHCSNSVSKLETEIYEYLKANLSGKIIQSDRSQISPYELDIFIPELSTAIEFNGVYFHSEKFKPKDYHRDKLIKCQENNIRLIQIWEDDYLRNPDLVFGTLSHKLGISQQEKTPARKTYAQEITYHEAKAFLDQNHIQGSAKGTYYLGLHTKESNTLVAVMVLKRTKNTLTLERYATAQIVPGGQSKLLSYVDKNIPHEVMYTFADLEISDGTLYHVTGWAKDKELPPDYKYLYRGTRHHKFNFRKDRFMKDPLLEYDPNLTETQLAKLNGLLRVWDSGKIRYVRYPSR